MEENSKFPVRDLEQQFSLLSGAGDLIFQYQVTRGINFYGRMLVRAGSRNGEHELYGETRLPLLNRATSHRLLVLKGGKEIREEAKSGENLHLMTSFFPDEGPGRLTVVPARGPTREYPLETRAFPVSVFLSPFLAYCCGEMLLHYMGTPCWVVSPARTAASGTEAGALDRIQLRTLTPLEGSDKMDAATLEGAIIDSDPKNGIPMEMRGAFQGYRVKFWR